MEDEQLTEYAIDRLNNASRWLIEDGVSTYLEKDHRYLKSYLIDQYKVNLWVTTAVDTERFLALFKIKARGINYDIQSLHREIRGNATYEFWIIRVSSASWANVDGFCRFYVTTSDSAVSKRTIIEESQQFIPSIALKDGSKIDFPIDDMQVLYDLDAWWYPESYEGTEVPLERIEELGNGEYRFVQP